MSTARFAPLFDSPAAEGYLAELAAGVPASELEAVLEAIAADDVELSQEQCALAAVLAEAADPGRAPVAAAAAAVLSRDPAVSDLYPAARDSVNRLLNNPYAQLWVGQDDILPLRRALRAVRTRLHRACTTETA